MLEFSLTLAKNTDGYFDPTVSKRLTELGYGRELAQHSLTSDRVLTQDYRDIEILGDDVILHGDIELEFGGVGK